VDDLKEIFDGAFKTIIEVVSGKDESHSTLREPSVFEEFPFLCILGIVTGVMVIIRFVSEIVAIPFGYVIPESLGAIEGCFVSILGAFLGVLVPYVRNKRKEDIPVITILTVIIVLSSLTSFAINIYTISDSSHPIFIDLIDVISTAFILFGLLCFNYIFKSPSSND
jgi:hypothetical protein